MSSVDPIYSRDCAVKKNGTSIGFAQNFQLTIDGNIVPLTSIGDTWRHKGRTVKNAVISFEYIYDKADTNQNAIKTAALSETGALTDIEFWFDSTSYWTVDIATDSSARFLVASWGLTVDNENALSTPVSLEVSGPIAEFTS